MSTGIHDEKYWESQGLGIAGRQLVKTGNVNAGDLMVYKKSGEREIYEYNYEYESVRSYRPYARIYRKIPTPKQGDCEGLMAGDVINIKHLPAGVVIKHEPASCMDKFYDECKSAGFDPDTGKQKAKTYDDGKPPLARLPWAAIEELSMVQLYGQQKYGDFDNYRKGLEATRNISCAIRHLVAWVSGCDNDAESGRSHLGHALCRIAFVLQNQKDGTMIDDRYKKPEKATSA